MKKILIGIALLLVMCSQSQAETSVWKVQKAGSVMYLGGTFHLLRPSDFPLPPEFEEAYEASDVLVLETDLGKLGEPSTQKLLLSKASYDDGTTIGDHISAQTYSLLDKYCSANGIPLAALSKLKPSILAVTITMMKLAKLGVTQEGVDQFFYRSAKKDGKPVDGLETVEEQIGFLLRMGEGNEDAFLAYSINDLRTVERQFDRFVAAWRRGDAGALNALMIADLQMKTPKLYRMLLVERNRKWLPLIDSYQKTPEKEFILVGAAHLVGPDGILEALRKKGYQVDQLQ